MTAHLKHDGTQKWFHPRITLVFAPACDQCFTMLCGLQDSLQAVANILTTLGCLSVYEAVSGSVVLLRCQNMSIGQVQWVNVPRSTFTADHTCLGHYSVILAVSEIFLEDVLFAHCLHRMKRVQELSVKLIQRINIHFCVKIGLPFETVKNAIHLAFLQDCLSDRRIRFWFNAFSNGRTTLVDLQRRPRAKTSRSAASIQAVKTLVDADPRITLGRLQHLTSLPLVSLHAVLHKDLHLNLRCARFVPFDLTARHLRLRYENSRGMLNAIRADPAVLKRVITSDKAWVYQYDPETRRQSSQWLPPGAPCQVKPRRVREAGKVLLVTFFDHKGMVHYEMLRNQTVTSAVFIGILGRLHQALRCRRPRMRHSWILHMDNASAHTARPTCLHLLFTGVKTLPHPPRSPDLAPNDYWFFPRLKQGLKGRHFASLDLLEQAVHHPPKMANAVSSLCQQGWRIL